MTHVRKLLTPFIIYGYFRLRNTSVLDLLSVPYPFNLPHIPYMTEIHGILNPDTVYKHPISSTPLFPPH